MSSAPSNSSAHNVGGQSPQGGSNMMPQKIGDYEMYETVGKGSFGKVKRGIHVPTGERVAIKILNRQKLKNANMDKKIKREINILQLFRHPNICRLYEVLQTQEDIFLIMEYIDGGELYDYIVKMGQLKEDAARYVFQQIICAIEYCHHFRVVHRDLKPENILLGQNLQVKIIDFGLANLMRDGDFLATSCGSPNYAAPEVISGKLYCGPEVDVWSAGVVLYALLCGCLPFDEDSIPQLFAKIKKGRYEVPPHLSSGARGLLAQLLTVDPLHRATIPQVRDNVWFNMRLPTHLAFNEVLYTEQDRIQQSTIRQLTNGMSSEAVRQVRADVSNKKGRAYVAYCILTDALRRRELNNYGSSVVNSSEAAGNNNSNGGGLGSPQQQAGIGSPTGSNAGGRQTASQRELNLGLILSINPAIEAMLDGGDATSNKDLYNNSTFLPVSNRSITSIGTPNLTRNSSQLSSSHTGGGGLMGGFGGGQQNTNYSNNDMNTGAGFSLTRRPAMGSNGNGCGPNVGSILGGGGMGTAADSSTGSLRNPTTLSRFSPQTKATPPTTAIDNPRVGSVAKTTLVYTAAEAEVALAVNAGWRVGIMTNKLSNQIMSELYDVLTGLDMCWKVLSPYRVAAKYNDPPRNALGARRQQVMVEASRRNVIAIKQQQLASPSYNSTASSPTVGGFPAVNQHQLLTGAASSSSSSQQQQMMSTSSSNNIVGAAVSFRPPIITFHLFRLQEKHDKGYIIDFGVRGGEQPMVAMDLIVEIFDALRRRIG